MNEYAMTNISSVRLACYKNGSLSRAVAGGRKYIRRVFRGAIRKSSLIGAEQCWAGQEGRVRICEVFCGQAGELWIGLDRSNSNRIGLIVYAVYGQSESWMYGGVLVSHLGRARRDRAEVVLLL